ncbi:YesL family protein [Gracilibacillus timonensis]|uniref:YesL family protein n=1 Tax=Gracilibacillus timonensis TaxID=1816696 RepID=UPI0008249FDB|nr:DUF624 domain-containing protein [Gracilibacillus timonensis]
MKNMMNGMEWIAKIAYLNILWLGFSLLGAVIFGVFPATVTMFIILRKWLMGNIDEWNIKMFYTIYKKEFIKSNVLGLTITVTLFLFYVNIQYMSFYQNSFHDLIKFPLTMVMIVVGLTLLYVIPVYVHYQISLKEVFKYSFYLMSTHPLINLGLLICITLTIAFLFVLPNAIFFFSGSLIAYIIMRTCLFVFNRVAERQKMHKLRANY